MGALAIGQGTVIVTHKVQSGSHLVADTSQPIRIVKRLGDAFGFLQVHEFLLKALECRECTAQREPEINGLLLLVTRFREVAESLQSLFQAVEGLPVRRLFLG